MTHRLLSFVSALALAGCGTSLYVPPGEGSTSGNSSGQSTATSTASSTSSTSSSSSTGSSGSTSSTSGTSGSTGSNGSSGNGLIQLGQASFQSAEYAIDGGDPLNNPGPTGLVVSDFDEDGNPDLIVAANQSIEMLTGHADGTFGSPNTLAQLEGSQAPIPVWPTVFAADLDGDHHSDLFYMSGPAYYLLGKGDGSFENQVEVPALSSSADTTFAGPDGISIEDLNGDGRPDILMINNGGNSSDEQLVLGWNEFGAPAGGFVQYVVSDSFDYNSLDLMTVGTVNANGKLAGIFAGGTTILTRLWDSGSSSFGSSTFSWVPSDQVTVLVLGAILADMDNDDLPDLVAMIRTNTTNTPSGEGIAVFKGNGDGSFATPTIVWNSVTMLSPNIVAWDLRVPVLVADLDGDGWKDVVVAHMVEGSLAFYRGGSNGLSVPVQVPNIGSFPTGIVAADFNHDGKLDLAVSHQNCYAIEANRSPCDPIGDDSPGITVLLSK